MNSTLTKLHFNSRSEVEERRKLNSGLISQSEEYSISSRIRANIRGKYVVGTQEYPKHLDEIDNYAEYDEAIKNFYAQFSNDDLVLQWLDKVMVYRDYVNGISLKQSKFRLHMWGNGGRRKLKQLFESIGSDYVMGNFSDYDFNGYSDEAITIYKNGSVKIHSKDLYDSLLPHIKRLVDKNNLVILD